MQSNRAFSSDQWGWHWTDTAKDRISTSRLSWESWARCWAEARVSAAKIDARLQSLADGSTGPFETQRPFSNLTQTETGNVLEVFLFQPGHVCTYVHYIRPSRTTLNMTHVAHNAFVCWKNEGTMQPYPTTAIKAVASDSTENWWLMLGPTQQTTDTHMWIRLETAPELAAAASK